MKHSLLRALLRPFSLLNPYKAPSKNPSKKHLLLKNLLRSLLRSVLLHDPLGHNGVQPIIGLSDPTEIPPLFRDRCSDTPVTLSEQLPCRSAEVKIFSVFLCQRCREIWREILVKFSALRFPGFGCATENFTKISRQKRCGERKISRKFHSAGAQR